MSSETAAVSFGENVPGKLKVTEIYFRKTDGTLLKLVAQEDSENPGIYVLVADTDSGGVA